MKKSIFSAVIATLLAVTLAACSPSGAKQVVLHPATGGTDTYTLSQRANIVGDLDLSDSTIDTINVVIEEQVPGGSWAQLRKFSVKKTSTTLGFSVQKKEAGDYQYRAVISGEGYGPFTSAPITVKYKAAN